MRHWWPAYCSWFLMNGYSIVLMQMDSGLERNSGESYQWPVDRGYFTVKVALALTRRLAWP